MKDFTITRLMQKLLLMLFVVLLIASCASMGSPGGGPVDETAPFIVQTQPNSGDIYVSPKSAVQITFSEDINHATFAEALFISPPPAEKPKIRWKEKTVNVRFADELAENKTLVVTIGANVQDLQNNKLGDSYTFAFSTGESIADGSISGQVFGLFLAQNMLVGCWDMSYFASPDSFPPDPSLVHPPYITQVGTDFHFDIQYLSAGEYFLMAWTDKDNDRLFKPGVDLLALPWLNIQLEENRSEHLILYPTQRDTGDLKPLMASPTDNSHLTLRFNRKLDDKPIYLLRKLAIRDTLGDLPLISAWIDNTDSSKMVLWTGPQMPDNEYRLFFDKDSTDIVLSGVSRPDTLGISVTAYSPRDRVRDVPNQPTGWVDFSDALASAVWDSTLKLTTIDSISVPLKVFHSAANRLSWSAMSTLEAGVTCRLELNCPMIFDNEGNAFTDSSWMNSFTIVDPTKTGEIAGVVGNAPKSGIRVIANSLRSRGTDGYSVIAAPDGSYRIDLLPEGKYTLWAYADQDADGKYSFGTLKPMKYAERMTICPDTVNVRSRWETGGIDFSFTKSGKVQ